MERLSSGTPVPPCRHVSRRAAAARPLDSAVPESSSAIVLLLLLLYAGSPEGSERPLRNLNKHTAVSCCSVTRSVRGGLWPRVPTQAETFIGRPWTPFPPVYL